MIKPNNLQFPPQARVFESELKSCGVPWSAFKFKKLDLGQIFQPLIYENAKGKVYKVSPEQQQRGFHSICNNIFKPRLAIIGTGQGGGGYHQTTHLILWLLLQAYQNRTKADNRLPKWYPLYNNFENKLLSEKGDSFNQRMLDIQDPSFLVLDNLYENSSNLSINKAQDIIYHYRNLVPIMIIANGTTSLEFSQKHLNISANYYFQVGPQRQVIAI